MAEKIIRLKLADCYDLRDTVLVELREHRNEFVNNEYILDFEKE
jgi:hypothetical protein